MKIYTRTGDDGTTSLGGGQRVPKDSLRVRAYGSVDELNSVLGVARAGGLAARLAEMLAVIQHELFDLGANLAFLEADKAKRKIALLKPEQVKRLEDWIDELSAQVSPLSSFILPGGSPGAAHLHLARTVCRRAEREVLALARAETIDAQILAYLNRLADLLFVMARYENHERGLAEPLWHDPV